MKISLRHFILFSLFLLLIILFAFISLINSKVTNKLDGVLWTVPAKVYSRQMVIAEGIEINKGMMIKELSLHSYIKKSLPKNPGDYSFKNDSLSIFLRGHEDQEAGLFKVNFSKDKVVSIKRSDGIKLDLIKLEPLAIGGMFPSHMEDRLIVNWHQVPESLIEILLSIEDQTFFEHHGLSLKSILRAFYQNVLAMDIKQGGSTVTQQLAKNLFFSSQRSLSRKLQEAIAAILIEFHYSKEEILLAYINDVYLSQAGTRSINGFGLGAEHFFGATLKNLEIDQLSLLVGMLKGPSLYNPRRNPERALSRRNLILDILEQKSIISSSENLEMKEKPLGLVSPKFRSETKYPAFHDLVRIELNENFKDSDLRTQGLRIFTNLDPIIQESLAKSFKKTKIELIKKYGKSLEDLEGAAIVVDSRNGEIRALLGSSSPNSFGFNRALNAVRPVGSLLKPFVYLTALKDYKRYNLSTLLDDTRLTLNLPEGGVWEPNNFDKKFHGIVPLHQALWDSYNIATVRLGLDIGYEDTIKVFNSLGIEKEIPNYPSLFIGSFEMTPIEMIQAYQTIASNGFFTPLRAVREIRGIGNDLAFSYPYKIEQRFRPEPIYLLKFALQQTFVRGTARGFSKKEIKRFQTWGKTGTSNDQRDSWFVGYAGDYLVLIWLGFDDNRESPLTGRSGSFQVWKDFIKSINPIEFKDNRRELARINNEWVDLKDGLLSGQDCKNSISVPFIKGSEPLVTPDARKKCRVKEKIPENSIMDKVRKILEDLTE